MNQVDYNSSKYFNKDILDKIYLLKIDINVDIPKISLTLNRNSNNKAASNRTWRNTKIYFKFQSSGHIGKIFSAKWYLN